MIHESALTDQTAVARQRVIAILRALADKARAFELPAPPAALEESRQKLADNIYTVLVVGEAKRGKSSFVNALIGCPLLPTDVDVATNQVFRVKQAEHEAFRLRFEDDSSRAITADDLPRYGSQVVADAAGTPRLDQIIRWIEVDVPVRFLGAGLSLLDTPGLGSLYAAHAQITQRFVPHADAVIFVLDSSQPIGQSELDFIKTILAVTPQIFFVQTKIDQYRKEEWQAILQRNQAILQAHFPDQLADVRIWPISNTHLLKSAATGDDDYLMMSRQPELAAALQAFLFRLAGWDRAAGALVAASEYHTASRAILAGRLSTLADEAKQLRADLQERTSQRNQQFAADWGPRGSQRLELMTQIRQVIAAGKQDFSQVFRPGDALSKPIEDRIAKLKTIAEANQLGKEINGDVIGSAGDAWQRIGGLVQARCLDALGPFTLATQALSLPVDVSPPDLVVDAAFEEFKQDWKSKARNTYSASSSMWGILTCLHFPGSGLLVSLSALWMLARGGANLPGSMQLQQIQQALRKLLNDVLQEVRQYYFDVDLSAGRLESRIDEYFHAFERAIGEQMQQVAEQKAVEAKAELDRLIEAAKLGDQQRSAKAEQIQRDLAEWDGIGREIQAAIAYFKAMTPTAAVAAPTAPAATVAPSGAPRA